MDKALEKIVEKALKKTIRCRPYRTRLLKSSCRARWLKARGKKEEIHRFRCDPAYGAVYTELYMGLERCLDCKRGEKSNEGYKKTREEKMPMAG